MLVHPLRLRLRLEAVECDPELGETSRASAEWSSSEISFTRQELMAVVADLMGGFTFDGGAVAMLELFASLLRNPDIHDILVAKIVGQLAARYNRERLAAAS